MNSLLSKIFLKLKNPDYINLGFKKILKETKIKIIFDAIDNFSSISEIRYVGGCVRKIINKEKVDDIDLAVNLVPDEVCGVLEKNKIKFYRTGIDHGTITAVIDNQNFEITSLRKDIDTDGRHAKVVFSKNWKEDASRRDFTINSIYADKYGNLFDPFNGKQDLQYGVVRFIGDAETRIKEDYLRILRYFRFFLNYSKKKHNIKIIKTIKKNLDGLSKISNERLLDEFKKLFKSNGFKELFKDKASLEIINLIFPEIKNISVFKRLNSFAKKNIKNMDFIFLLALMIIDGTDNVDYFIYKFNISKRDQKRLLFINSFFSQKKNIETFSENNMNKIFYFNGRQALLDIIYFKIFKSNKIDEKLLLLIENFKDKKPLLMPLKADTLISKYRIPEGKELGVKLKMIEELWVKNNFKISEQEIKKIVNF